MSKDTNGDCLKNIRDQNNLFKNYVLDGMDNLKKFINKLSLGLILKG